MICEVRNPHYVWRRVRAQGAVSYWQLVPGIPPLPPQTDLVLDLLRNLSQCGESMEVVGEMESDKPYDPPLTVVLQRINQPTEVRT